MKDLFELLPVYRMEKDAIVSKMGDITIAFKLTLPEIFTLSGEEYEALHHTWVRAVRVLPASSVLYKQDWFIEADYKAAFENGDSFLSRCSERFFNERPFLDHECFLMLTKKPANRKMASSLSSGLLQKSIVPEETLDPKFFQDFLSYVGQFEKILVDSGFVTLQRLGNADLFHLVTRYLSLEGGKPTLRDISFRDEWKIGENYCQLFTLADTGFLPSWCGPRMTYDKYSTDKTKFSIGFAASLGQLLSCNHIYSQYIFLDDVPKTMRKLENKRLRLQSLSAYSRENLLAKEATDNFLNEAISEQRLPVKAHFNILAWTDDKAAVRGIRNRCYSALTQIDATPKLETEGAPQIFWAGIPGNAADFPMNDAFDTFSVQACCFFNLETAYRSSLSPVGIRLGDRLCGKPIHVDISDEPMERGIITNRNKFIVGPSGSGKSFFTNHLVRSYYEQGAHIVLVDVGHSYKALCSLLGGYYFTYAENQPIQFNPFYSPQGMRIDTEKRESIKSLLLALWKKDNEAFRRSEYVALSNALQLYFDKVRANDIFPCFNTFYEFLKDDFVRLLAKEGVKEKDFDVSNFLYVLRPYYKGGELDFLLNAEENLDLLHQRMMVFELDSIKDHPILFPVVTIIIMEVFIAKMRTLKGVRKMILIEEAWKAIAKEGMAEYVKYLFKTVRKFFGEAVVVTQDIEDIISSPIVKETIINNSDCKILLDQSKYQNRFDGLQQLLGLTEKEKTLVLSINKANDPAKKYKEVFIGLGNAVSKVYRVEVSPEEYLAYTTEEKEKMRVQQYIEKWGGDWHKGIKAMADDLRLSKN